MTEVFESLRIDQKGRLVQVRKYPWMLAWLLRWLQRKCKHHTMKADLLEGDCPPYAIRWCETCGAVLYVLDGTPCGVPRMCEPMWEK